MWQKSRSHFLAIGSANPTPASILSSRNNMPALAQALPDPFTEREVSGICEELVMTGKMSTEASKFISIMQMKTMEINAIKLNKDRGLATERELKEMRRMEKDMEPHKRAFARIMGAFDLRQK
ncbi:hypothetical protein NMY22_g12616 [Coprinellus aureogranulatus]|nr:hypothetical protein NMY22_g12616 [Coprinellus aureogranulatus]